MPNKFVQSGKEEMQFGLVTKLYGGAAKMSRKKREEEEEEKRRKEKAIKRTLHMLKQPKEQPVDTVMQRKETPVQEQELVASPSFELPYESGLKRRRIEEMDSRKQPGGEVSAPSWMPQRAQDRIKKYKEEENKKREMYYQDPDEFQEQYGISKDFQKWEGKGASPIGVYGPGQQVSEAASFLPDSVEKGSEVVKAAGKNVGLKLSKTIMDTLINMEERGDEPGMIFREWGLSEEKIEKIYGDQYVKPGQKEPSELAEKLWKGLEFIEQTERENMENLDEPWQKKAFMVADGATTLGMAMGVYAMTRDSKTAGLFNAQMDSSSVYIEARRAGKSPTEAREIYSKSFAGSYMLEKIGFDHLLKGEGKGMFKNFVKKFVSEGSQELIQTGFQDYVANQGYDKAYSSLEEYWDSFWVGGLLGGGVSVAMDFSSPKSPDYKAMESFKDMGMNEESAKKAAEDFKTWSLAEGHKMMQKMHDQWSFKESRMAGFKGMEPGSVRPGIDAPAPLPDVEVDGGQGPISPMAQLEAIERVTEAVKKAKRMATQTPKKTPSKVDVKVVELDKQERMNYLEDEIKKRVVKEKAVAKGEFKLADETAKSIRKSGGMGMAVVDLVDKGAGKVTSASIKAAGKVLDKITDLPKLKDFKNFAKSIAVKLTPQAGLDTDMYKAFETYRKAKATEFEGVRQVMEGLAEVTSQEISVGDAFKYLTGEDVKVSKEAQKVLDPIRDEIDIEGLRQVQQGTLPFETFQANMGKYMRRLYKSHQVDGYNPLGEKYTALVKAFKGKGLSGVQAEEAIMDIMTKNLKGKYKGVLPESIKQGGDFQKKRKLGSDPLSKAIRDFLGEIKDPQYIVGRTLFDMKRSRLNAELHNRLLQTEMVQDERPPGEFENYKKLEGKGWGVLEGKYMSKDVFNYMEGMKADDETLGETLTKLNNFMKTNLTVRSPAGQFRNLTSNFATSQAILGHNYISPRGVKDMVDAIKSLKSKDVFYQELLAYGRIGDTGITHDLGKRLDQIVSEHEKGGKAKRFIKGVDGLLAKGYEFGDNLFLMANYKKMRAKGMPPAQAIVEANKVTPDYGEIPPIIAKARRSVVGLPFVTWRYKVYPEIVKAAFKTPLRTTMPIWFPWALGNIIAEGLDLTEKEKEVFKTSLYRDGKIPLMRGESGDVVYFPYAQYTPFADMFKGKYTPEKGALGFLPEHLEGYVSGSVPGVGSFPVQTLLKLSQNYDPFTGRPISYEDAWSLKWGWDMAAAVAPQMLPVAGMSANNINRVAKGDLGVGEAALKSMTGMAFQEYGVGRFEKEQKYEDPGFSMDKNKQNIYRKASDIAKVAERNPEEANAMLDKLYDENPGYEDYIKTRVRYEKDKVVGKSKAYQKIRDEVTSLIDIASVDPSKANKRVDALYDDYPEYEEYITKKLKEAKEGMG